MSLGVSCSSRKKCLTAEYNIESNIKGSEGDEQFVNIFYQVKVVDLGYSLNGRGNEVRKLSEDKNNDSTARYNFYRCIPGRTG